MIDVVSSAHAYFLLMNISSSAMPPVHAPIASSGQHFDPRNELVVAKDQFARVLSAQGLLPNDAQRQQLLFRRYGVSDFRRQTTVHQVHIHLKGIVDRQEACTAVSDANNGRTTKEQ